MDIATVTAEDRSGDAPGLAVPVPFNCALAVGHVALNLYQFFLLPLILLPASSWWGLTVVPVALMSNSFWSLIHEAIHDHFHLRLRSNYFAGRFLSVFFGSSFLLLRLSHLLHHKLNRSPREATEAYDPAGSSAFKAAAGYYFQILGGLYLVELISPLLFLFPRWGLAAFSRRCLDPGSMSALLVRSLAEPRALRDMRVDTITVAALLISSFVCYGENWAWLAGSLAVRAFLISFLDNVYHYGTRIDDTAYASNLWLAPLLAKGLLHFNLHGVHHKNPALPWAMLPAAYAQEGRPFDGSYFTAAARQLAGPVPIERLSAKSGVLE
jgi:fatty acid desaturase